MFVLTDTDLKRLEQVLQAVAALPATSERCRMARKQLEQVISQAVVVSASDVPADVVTLESRLVIRDRRTGGQRTFRVHLPQNPAELLPMLAAVLGHRIGDKVQCECCDPPCDFELEGMKYQPESATPQHLMSGPNH